MLHWRHHGVLLVAALTCGCGTIVELPNEEPGTGGDEGTSGSGTTEPDGTTSPGASSETTSPNPDDDIPTGSTSTTEGSSSSTTSVSMPMSIPICGNPALDIPEDGTWVEAPIEVPSQAGAVLDLDVAIRIQHEHVSQLRAQLRAPNGTVVSLLDTPTCEGAGLDAVFDDEAESTAEEACSGLNGSAISGAVTPLDPLGPLLADPVAGTWILEVTDATPGQTGWLDQACIVLTVEAR